MLLASVNRVSAFSCNPTVNNCSLTATVTTSHLQIGGQGSLGSRGRINGQGVLSDQTLAEALYQFTFDRSTGRLTLVATNTTTTQSVLSGIFFNATADVTGVTLLSHNGVLPWTAAFDRVRTDGVVDTFPFLPYLRGDGFGIYSIFVGNKAQLSTDVDAGDPDIEILPGHSVTFVFQITGNLPDITACTFTSVGSIIPPGDKIVRGLGRFQGGVSGGIGYIGPCEGGSLLVTLAGFSVVPADGQVTAMWDTASEVDNAGFRILRTDVRTNRTVALNRNLIPAQGSPVSGFSYAYVDDTALNGKKYLYRVEDFDTDGFNTIHRAELAIPNPSHPPVRLLEPAYESKAGRQVRLKWETDGRWASIVEISAEASFPAGATLQLRAGTRTARSLTARELSQVRAMGAAGEGGVYWRVTGRDGRRNVSHSQTFFLSVTD